jgi:hypothetical protein
MKETCSGVYTYRTTGADLKESIEISIKNFPGTDSITREASTRRGLSIAVEKGRDAAPCGG